MKPHILVLILLALAPTTLAAPPVEVTRLPDRGMQPRIALSKDAVHLVYLTGDPRHSDIQYRRLPADANTFTPPVRVNSNRGSAIATGTVRGAELAIDNGGRVHVVWNGADQTTMKVGDQSVESSPVLYSNSDDGKVFTDEQNVMHNSWYLDGGASIAVLGGEHVHPQASHIAIVWHAADGSKPAGEENRGVFLALSKDRGETFAPETRIDAANDGACACCGLHAFADFPGHLGILYRRAYKGEERDQTFMLEIGQNNWQRTRLDTWPAKTCPMSTSDAFVLGDGVLLAWETKGQVWLGKWNGQLMKTMTAAPGQGNNRKHPRLTAAFSGEILLVWTEGTAWDKGGSIAWHQFDADLQPVEGTSGRAEGLPVWGTAAPWPSNSGFTIVY